MKILKISDDHICYQINFEHWSNLEDSWSCSSNL